MPTARWLRSVVVVLAIPSLGVAAARAGCPAAVVAAARHAVPDAAVRACARDGARFEVTLRRKDWSVVELDITAAGAIEQTEERVPTAAVPATVTAAFAAKYPHARITGAEKQTAADGAVSYELAYRAGKKKREATFAADGTWLETE